MRGFAVEVEEVETVVADLSATQRRLEALGADLDVQIRALHDGWAGVAAAVHDSAQQRWCRSLDELRAALSALAAAGANAAESYREASDTNVAMWGQLS